MIQEEMSMIYICRFRQISLGRPTPKGLISHSGGYYHVQKYSFFLNQSVCFCRKKYLRIFSHS